MTEPVASWESQAVSAVPEMDGKCAEAGLGSCGALEASLPPPWSGATTQRHDPDPSRACGEPLLQTHLPPALPAAVLAPAPGRGPDLCWTLALTQHCCRPGLTPASVPALPPDQVSRRLRHSRATGVCRGGSGSSCSEEGWGLGSGLLGRGLLCRGLPPSVAWTLLCVGLRVAPCRPVHRDGASGQLFPGQAAPAGNGASCRERGAFQRPLCAELGRGWPRAWLISPNLY